MTFKNKIIFFISCKFFFDIIKNLLFELFWMSLL